MTTFAPAVVAWRGEDDGEGVPTTPGRLEGQAVLVVHGDADVVIPRDLLDRTWTYLDGEAGSTTTAARDPGDHGLGAAAVRELDRWLQTTADDKKDDQQKEKET